MNIKIFNNGHKWIILVSLVLYTSLFAFIGVGNIYIGEYIGGLIGIVLSFLGMAGCSEIRKWIRKST